MTNIYGRLAERFTPVFFSVFSSAYEWLTTHPMQSDAIGALSDVLPREAHLLDVACGPGVILDYLLTQAPGRTGVGVDSAPGAVERAQRRIEAVVGRGEALPFDDGAFDVAYISGALYLMDRPAEVLREMARVSRQRVVILEAVPSLETLRASLDPRTRLSAKERLDFVSLIVTMHALNRYRVPRITELMQRAGLQNPRTTNVAGGLWVIAEGDVA